MAVFFMRRSSASLHNLLKILSPLWGSTVAPNTLTERLPLAVMADKDPPSPTLRRAFFSFYSLHNINTISDSKRQQTTTVDYKRLINGLVLTRVALLWHNSKTIVMVKKNPFDKEQPTKIPFSELMELIGTSCDYKFCIIDENIDEELMSLAASHGINLKGFKHVIETSGIRHAEKRHGIKSNDRAPLSLEDYLLIPFIIKNRDKVEVSAQTDISHHNTVLKYTKQIGDTYYYVEEIRKRNKSLAFKSLIKREKENPSKERG